MKIENLYSLYCDSYLVDTDTRKIRKNTIFFALKGENFNGNLYAEEALNKGAKYAIVDKIEYQTNDNIIVVENVLKTLQELASYHRKQLNIPIIALTGSNGKTTTKELINVVLKQKFKTTATKGNLNNHIGVPLTLLSMTPDTEIGIVEMGANHHKEIEFLSKIAAPDYGYITNFGKAHLEGFGSIEGVIEAKSELYEFLIRNNGNIFVNPKDEIQVSKTRNSNKILFSEGINFLTADPFVCLNYDEFKIQSNLIGSYNFNNIAIAITIGEYFKVLKRDIKSAIESYIPENNRSQIVVKGSNQIILDAYNANPTSMEAALKNFKQIKTENNKIVILGDMFELGNTSELEHQNIANYVNELLFDKVILVGNNFCKVNFEGVKFKDFDELKEYIKKINIERSTILIKGSRGMALERLLQFVN